ncbi:MAG TPA: [Fe-Fe] hydrogenase large subunit C-terminal domain-containing protein, partial [Rectinemataceae bacterium]|nr:[Fe-Fe] hydrogenase large subunit C-terminal domain-containing protein [Rectinemataceae bacterium]
IPNLVPFLPPVEVAAREIRSRFASAGKQGVGIFFISPCTSKVTAMRAPLGYAVSQVNAVFSFRDIYAALKQSMKVPADEGGRTVLPRIPGLGNGFSWARSDGELEALDIPGAVSVDGIGNVIALFEEIDNGKLSEISYIEALACPGGCVGGPMAVANPHVARSAIKAIAKKEAASPGETAALSPLHRSPASLQWDEELLPKPVMVLDRDMLKALQMAEEMEALAAGLPGLDCGACGAPDCRALAEDMVKGCAKIDDCIVRMKEKSAMTGGISN